MKLPHQIWLSLSVQLPVYREDEEQRNTWNYTTGTLSVKSWPRDLSMSNSLVSSTNKLCIKEKRDKSSVNEKRLTRHVKVDRTKLQCLECTLEGWNSKGKPGIDYQEIRVAVSSKVECRVVSGTASGSGEQGGADNVLILDLDGSYESFGYIISLGSTLY